SAYIVESGLVALTLVEVADRQRVVALAGPGDIIGAVTPNLEEHRSGAVALSAEVAARLLPARSGPAQITPSGSADPQDEFSGLLAAAAGDQIQRLTWALEDSAHPVPARVARAFLRLGQ